MQDTNNAWLLGKAEKLSAFLKVDVTYLLKGSFWLTVSQTFNSLAAFILAILFAHFIDKDTYGIYRYLLSISATVGALMLSGIGASITQSIAKGFDSSLRRGFKSSLSHSGLFVVVMLALSSYYGINQNYTLSLSCLLISILSPFYQGFLLYDSALIGKSDFYHSAIYTTIRSFFVTGVMAIVLLMRPSALYLIAAYFLSSTLITYILYKTSLKLIKETKNEEDQSLISRGRHLSLVNVVSTLSDNIDQLLLFHYLGGSSLAIYNFAIAMPDQIKALIKNLGSVALPRFAMHEDSLVRKELKRKISILTLSIVPVVIAYVVAAPYLFKWLFPKYMDSVLYSQIFAISLIFMGQILPTSFMQAKAMIKSIYTYNITVSLIQIVVLFVAIKMGGLIGVVIARVVVRFFNFIISLFFI